MIETDLTAVVLTKDQQSFLCEALDSLDVALPRNVRIMIVDIGSTDHTSQIIEAFKTTTNRAIDSVRIVRGPLTTVAALQALQGRIRTSWISVLSGDDLVKPSYGVCVSGFVRKSNQPSVLNFELEVVDSALNHLRYSRPRWSSNSFLNRRLISFENPGRAPGAVIPWNLVERSDFMKFDPRCLIEDHLLWVALRDCVRFKTFRGGHVVYRRHSESLSLKRENTALAWSLGYCIGVTEARCSSLLDRLLVTAGLSRWQNQVVEELTNQVWEGRISGRATAS